MGSSIGYRRGRENPGRAHEIADEPGGKEIEPMSMCCAAMDAEDRRAASRAIIQVMQSRSAKLDKMIGVGGRLEASPGR